MTAESDGQRFFEKLDTACGFNSALIVADEQGIICFWNHMASSLLGYTAEQALAQPVDRLLFPHDPSLSLLDVCHQDSVQTSTVRHKDNSKTEVEYHLTFFRIGGQRYAVFNLRALASNAPRSGFDVGTRKPGPLTPEYSLLEGSSLSNHGSEWLISYLDIMTLILIFFVLAYVLSPPQPTGARNQHSTVDTAGASPVIAAAKKSGKLPPATLSKPEQPPRATPLSEITASQTAMPLPDTEPLLLQRLQHASLSEPFEIIHQPGRISLRIKDNILFATGSADISSRGEDLLYAVTDLVIDENIHITVEGHTDKSIINNDRYPSNWELSSARAAAVVRVLINQGVAPHRLKAVGYADTRPLFNSELIHVPENRRVELVLRQDISIAN